MLYLSRMHYHALINLKNLLPLTNCAPCNCTCVLLHLSSKSLFRLEYSGFLSQYFLVLETSPRETTTTNTTSCFCGQEILREITNGLFSNIDASPCICRHRSVLTQRTEVSKQLEQERLGKCTTRVTRHCVYYHHPAILRNPMT